LTGTDRVDGDELNREAELAVETFNDAAADYSPEIEWFGMSFDSETGDDQFVLQAPKYIDSKGLAALRGAGWYVHYVETYTDPQNGEQVVQIQVPVLGEVTDA